MNSIVNIILMLLFLAAIFFPVSQLLTKKLKAPDFLQNVIYFLMIGLFFANSGIADKPYHVIPFMTTKPALVETDSVRSIPDTLTNNMCMLLTLMAAMIILYTIIRLGFQLKVWVKGSYLDAITNYAAFFLYHLAILAVCLVTISVFGYGQLFLFCNYTSSEIILVGYWPKTKTEHNTRKEVEMMRFDTGNMKAVHVNERHSWSLMP